MGALLGGFGGGAAGLALAAPTGETAAPLTVPALSAAGALKGAAIGASAGAALDAGIFAFSKKPDIKQVDQAIRKALGRKPTDPERGDFRDLIHSEKDGGPDLKFKDLVRLAKEFFGGREE